MDPNETLRRLRELVDDAHSADQTEDVHELVAALDQWLSKGGYLPHAWTVSRRGGGSMSPGGSFSPRKTSDGRWVDSYGNEYSVEETLAGTTTFRRKDVAHTTPPDAPHTVDS